MFSKSCEYAIRATIYIATQSLKSNRVKLGDVAQNAGSPEAFTAKLLGILTKSQIIQSTKGPYGGFEIPKDKMNEIKISQIVYAIDGDSVYNGCGLGLSECDASAPCPMHDKFIKIRVELKRMLETTTIYDLATKIKSGKSILIR
ncbi:MAG: Rrf2 family transcriptional regulator [Chitinophagales bacterium]|nr:Rrf2 family transcriptional regulator [Chitinophagales bacterium]